MSACPDGSTECLLRALLDSQNKFDWNPPTFIVTLLIGVLALFVALATALQGLLFAGPGRLKATWRAIGPWSKFTHTSFSWTEFRFRTTTCVPYIASPGFYTNFDFESHAVAARWPYSKRAMGKNGHLNARAQQDRHSFAASWSNLLFTLSKSPHFETIKVDTEHLPADVRAVPALGTIEAIVKLAAISGCDSIKIDGGNIYPTVHGHSSQLSFREHPYLGLTCVYQQFPRTPTYRTKATIYDSAKDLSWWKADPQKKLDLLVQSANRKEWVSSDWDDGDDEESRTLADICPSQSPYSLLYPTEFTTSTFLVLLIDGWCPRIVPFEKFSIRGAMVQYWKLFPSSVPSGFYSSPGNTDVNKIVFALRKYFQAQSKPLYWELARLRAYHGDRMYNAHVAASPQPLPGSQSHNIKQLQGDIEQSDHVVNDLQDSSWLSCPGGAHRYNFRLCREPGTAWNVEELTAMDDNEMVNMDIKEYTQIKCRDRPPAPTLRIDESGLVILSSTLFHSLAWLQNVKQGFTDLDFDDKSRLRNAFMTQIRELDSWIRSHVECEASREAISMIREVHGWKPKGKKTKASMRKTRLTWNNEEEVLKREAQERAKVDKEGLRVLLLYRALLCACICATAADISCVEGTALGQQVVQIL